MNILSGVLLAGGRGTRLYPNTKVANKHLLPIYDKPMIYYSLSILMLAGIREITIVCNSYDLESFKSLLGDGEEFGIDLSYSLQDNPDGIPDAINVALENIKKKKFLVALGDNFIFGSDFFNALKEKSLENFIFVNHPNIEDYLFVDKETRKLAKKIITELWYKYYNFY